MKKYLFSLYVCAVAIILTSTVDCKKVRTIPVHPSRVNGRPELRLIN